MQGTSTATPYLVDRIGGIYTQAMGPDDAAVQHPKSLESTGDMMIVTSAYVRATSDTSIVSTNVSYLWKATSILNGFFRPIYTSNGVIISKTMLYPLVLSEFRPRPFSVVN